MIQAPDVERLASEVGSCQISAIQSSGWPIRSVPGSPTLALPLPPDYEATSFQDLGPSVYAWRATGGAFLILSRSAGRQVIIDPADERTAYVYEGNCRVEGTGYRGYVNPVSLAAPRPGPTKSGVIRIRPPAAYLVEAQLVADGGEVFFAAAYARTTLERAELLTALVRMRPALDAR